MLNKKIIMLFILAALVFSLLSLRHLDSIKVLSIMPFIKLVKALQTGKYFAPILRLENLTHRKKKVICTVSNIIIKVGLKLYFSSFSIFLRMLSKHRIKHFGKS